MARIADATTSTVTTKGYWTPAYAAPEQWDGQRATHATDIYALGCIGVELLTNAPPFPGPSTEDYARQHRYEPLALQKGSPQLRALLVEMLVKPEVARPSIEDTIRRLESASAPSTELGAGAMMLRDAATVVTEANARDAARQAAQKAELAQRRVLSAHATASLWGIVEHLMGQIVAQAGNAVKPACQSLSASIRRFPAHVSSRVVGT